MKRPALLILCLMLSHSALATKDLVYRWIDKDGVVHYSQTEPTKIRAETVEIRRAPETPVVPAPVVPPVAEKPTSADVENCALARANAQVLSSKQTVTMDKDGDGKMDPVSDEERKKTMVETERQIGIFCKET